MLLRIALASTAISLSSLTAFAAESIGIPACDNFLAKYQACVTNKVPADKKAMMQSGVDGMRKGWIELRTLVERDEIEREDVEEICRQAPAQMKQTFESFGCSLD